jgi:hypothetical protein
MASEGSLTITGDEPVFFLAGMIKQFTVRKWAGRMGWLGRSPACLVASMIGMRMYTKGGWMGGRLQFSYNPARS